MIIINFKTYEQGTGRKAWSLAGRLAKGAKHSKVPVYLVPQSADLHAISDACDLPLLAQHCDPTKKGSHTGAQTPAAAKANGAGGVLINHSESPMSKADITQLIKELKSLRMKSILCVKDLKQAKEYSKLKPSMVAIEPPELIGGKKSVCKAKPQLIIDAAKAVGRIPLLVGAGVHSKHDVVMALKLGAKGILVASDILKSKSPTKELKDLLAGFEE
jgi:triosephosphate isomerase (TIM)